MVKPLPFGSAYILSTVGGHGGSHSVKGAANEHGYLAGSGNGGDIHGSQAVDCRLDHNAANGGNGILESHRKAHQAQVRHPLSVPAPVLPAHLQNGEAPAHTHQAPHPRQQLGQHCCESRAKHIHMEVEDKHYIQHNVYQGGNDQPDHWGPAVPHGPQHRSGVVIQEVGRQARKNSDDIQVGTLENVGGGIHGGQDVLAENHRGGSQGSAEKDAQPGAAGNIPPQFLLIPGAKLLGHRDGKAAADSGAEAYHQEVDGTGGPHGSQGRTPQCLSYDGSVHHIIHLLEQIAKQQRNTKAQYQPHGAALGQVFCHKRNLSLRSNVVRNQHDYRGFRQKSKRHFM